MNYDKFIRDTNDLREIQEAEIEREMNPDFAMISDYVCGELSEDKAAEVRARLETDPEFRDLAEPLLLAWSVPRKTKPMSHEELRRSWLQLRRRAGMPPVPGQEEEADELAEFQRRREQARRSVIMRRVVFAASLVFLMLIPVVGTWWADRLDEPKTDLTRPTSTTTVQTWVPATVPLPDGSTATLSSGTTLKFDPTFANGREVHLVGEGRFEVRATNASGAGAFKVTTETAQLTVVGTSFTVTAFGQAGTHVTVREGRVRVRGLLDIPNRPGLLVEAGQSARVLPNSQPEIVRQ